MNLNLSSNVTSKNRAIFCLIMLIMLCSCHSGKINQPVRKTTQLPVSKEFPTLIEVNQGITSNLNYLSGDKNYIFYNFNPEQKGQNAEIRYVKILSKNPLKFSASQPLNSPDNNLGRYISSVVKIKDKTWIYYVEGESLKHQANSYRAQWIDEKLTHIEQLNIDKRLVVRSWQKFHYNHGMTYMVHTGSGLFFAKSEDGINFSDFSKLYGFSAQPRISNLGDNLITAFQTGNLQKGSMTALFSVSEDSGNSWSKPQKITDQHNNVHDAYLYSRADGNIDAYYVHPIGDWRGFSLFRRCIKPDFNLGQPELVIEKEIGSAIAPGVFQSAEDIMILFVEQLSGYNPHVLPINDNANCHTD
jgi:hypothetical protein